MMEFFVRSSQDSGPETLRAAIIASNEAPAQGCNTNLIIIAASTISPIILKSQILVTANVIILNQTGHCLTIEATDNRHFEVSATYFRLQNHLVLTGGLTVDDGGSIYGTSSNSEIGLYRVIIKRNRAGKSGGGIYTSGRVIATESSLINNIAGLQGGGVYAGKGIMLKSSHVDENKVVISQSSCGGGGIFVDDGEITLTDGTTVNHNSTSKTAGSGGGIVCLSGIITIQDYSHVDHNIGYSSAGVQQGTGPVYLLSHSTINHNIGLNSNLAAGGGGITITMGNVCISDSEVCHNETLGMYSGGIVSLIGGVSVVDSKISYNTNRGPGGGIACNLDGVISVTRSKLIGNIGASMGGAITNFSLKLGITMINDSLIADNRLTNAQTIGQTIRAFFDVIIGNTYDLLAQADLSGGPGGDNLKQVIPNIIAKAIEVNLALKKIGPKIDGIEVDHLVAGGAISSLLSCPVIISSNSLIISNHAGIMVEEGTMPISAFGGGIFGYLNGVTIDHSCLKGNRSLNSGAGIFANMVLNLDHTIISGNVVLEKEHGDGGGLYISIDATGMLNECLIKKNVSPTRGGGMANIGGVTVISGKIIHNTAPIDPNVYTAVMCQYRKYPSVAAALR